MSETGAKRTGLFADAGRGPSVQDEVLSLLPNSIGIS
jgi:hypothetical protein